MTYIGVYALLLLAAGLSIGQPALRRRLYGLGMFVLFVFVAFRYEVGCDWTGYLIIYQNQGLGTLASAFEQREPLFKAANWLLHAANLDYPYINVIAAAAYFGGFHLLARRQPDPLGMLALSFPLLVLHLAMSGIRQAMAIGILCMAFNAFNDRRVVLYVGLVVLAGGFHTSALVFLALAPFVVGDLSWRNIALGGVIAVPGLFFLASGDQFSHYYDRYVGTRVEAFGGPFRAGLLAITGMIFILLMRKRWQRLCPADYKLVWISALIMLALLPLTFISSVIGDRVGYYLMPAQFMILARFAWINQGVMPPAVLALPYVAAGVVLVAWTATSHHFQQCYVPYGSWLFMQ